MLTEFDSSERKRQLREPRGESAAREGRFRAIYQQEDRASLSPSFVKLAAALQGRRPYDTLFLEATAGHAFLNSNVVFAAPIHTSGQMCPVSTGLNAQDKTVPWSLSDFTEMNSAQVARKATSSGTRSPCAGRRR